MNLADSYQTFLDLKAKGTDLQPYMSQNNHPNRAGHLVVATELEKAFVSDQVEILALRLAPRVQALGSRQLEATTTVLRIAQATNVYSLRPKAVTTMALRKVSQKARNNRSCPSIWRPP